MNNIWLKRGLMAAGGLAVIGTLLYMLLPNPIAVDTAEIQRGAIRVTVDEEGKTKIKDVYVVSSPLAGRVERNPLHVGDKVIAGKTVVATISPTPPPMIDARSRKELEAQVAVAQSAVDLAGTELSQAQAEASLAQKELQRTQTLSKRGIVAERVLERTATDAKVRADAVIRAGQALQLRRDELRSIQSRLIGSDVTAGPDPEVVNVVAPASGKVLRLLAESETVVGPATPLVEIGDTANLEVVADLLSTDAVNVVEGAAVMIEGWGGPVALAGRVRRIEPAGFTRVSALGIEEQRVHTLIDIDTANGAAAALGHEFRVLVRIEVWKADAAVIVPLGALFRDRDRWAVFKVVDGRAARQDIDLGRRNAVHAEVTAGLDPGDVVILHPSDRVTDGGKVERIVE